MEWAMPTWLGYCLARQLLDHDEYLESDSSDVAGRSPLRLSVVRTAKPQDRQVFVWKAQYLVPHLDDEL